MSGVIASFDRFDPHARRRLAQSVVRTVLEDLNGMEEDAVWTKNRVLYVPGQNGRVCIDTRVERGKEWDDGIGYEYVTFAMSYRVHREGDAGDLLLRIREVRLSGTVESITRRVRNAMLEGLGVVAAATVRTA